MGSTVEYLNRINSLESGERNLKLSLSYKFAMGIEKLVKEKQDMSFGDKTEVASIPAEVVVDGKTIRIRAKRNLIGVVRSQGGWKINEFVCGIYEVGEEGDFPLITNQTVNSNSAAPIEVFSEAVDAVEALTKILYSTE